MLNEKCEKQRFSREDFLEEALAILSEEGYRLLTIDKICDRMHVSRGSFYWHFKNRSDFNVAIIEYWEQKSTTAFLKNVNAIAGSPEQRLGALLELVISSGYCKYELPMRLWAMREDATKKVLQRIDSTRYGMVRSLFSEMGFTGDDLEMRVQTCVIYYNFRRGFSIGMQGDKEAALLHNRLRVRMLTDGCATKSGRRKRQPTPP